MPSFPSIFIVRCHLKSGCVEDYLNVVKRASATWQASEHGLLHLVVAAAPGNPLQVSLTMMHESDESFMRVWTSESFAQILDQDRTFSKEVELEVHGDVGPKVRAALPLHTVDTTKFGFSRCNHKPLWRHFLRTPC